MPTYIRSKINTSTPVEIVIESEGSQTKLNQNGTFKIPGTYEHPESDLGALRYYDGRIQTKEPSGWQSISTTTEITAAVNALVDGAPAALDTLNELAAALNDDASFSSTITNLIAGKLSKSGGTMTGALILEDDPVNALGAATKNYVDTATSSIEVNSTDDVPEGDNLYFTISRARNSIGVSGNLNYDSSTGVISYSYTLPTASTSTLGGVKVDGTTITINNGVISGANTYVLPTASTSISGGVKVDGTTITIDNGVISGANTYVLPTASTSTQGGVKVDGTTITINNGVISSSENITGNAGTVTNGVYTTGSYSNPSWITSLAFDKLTGVPANYSLPTASTSTLGGVKVDGTTITINNGIISVAPDLDGGEITFGGTGAGDAGGSGSVTYTLPTASISTLGGVKVDGTTILITNGVISAVGGGGGGGISIGDVSAYLTTNGYISDFNSAFDTRLATKSTTNLTEGTNLYYTDSRVGNYLTTNNFATKSYVSGQVAAVIDTIETGPISDIITNTGNLVANTQEILNSLSGLPAVATSGSYTDLTNKPTIPPAQIQSDWNATSGLGRILNKPTLFSGAYADLTGKPTLFSGSYNDLTNKPASSFSGAYADLTGKPTLFSGSYDDLTNKPIGSVNVGSLTIGTGLSGTSYNGASNVTIANTGILSITGTSPISASTVSGATTISMAAATSTANGYMTSTYATKLNGIAPGATSNTGTVTSVSGTGTVNGLTLTGTVTTSGNLTLGGTLSGIANSATTATNLNTASAIVARDASGNFTAGTITASLTGNVTGSSGSCTGNAATATILQTPRAINGVNFNGSANITTMTAGTGIGVSGTTITNNGVTSNVGGTNISVSGATGAVTISTSATPIFTGITSGYVRPSTNATTAVQLQNAAGTSVLNVDTTNNRIGINNTAPVVALHVTGAGVFTGEVTAYYSDLRLKTDVVKIEDPIAKLMSIRGVHFNPNETALALGVENKPQIGVIAQEVEKVLPELVVDSGFEGYKTVKYDKLTALLIEAIKEQQVQINELKKEIEKLKNV